MLHTYIVKTTDGVVIVKSDSLDLCNVKQDALLMFEYPEYVRVISIADVESITENTVM